MGNDGLIIIAIMAIASVAVLGAGIFVSAQTMGMHHCNQMIGMGVMGNMMMGGSSMTRAECQGMMAQGISQCRNMMNSQDISECQAMMQ